MNLASRLLALAMRSDICNALEQSDVYVLFQYLLAVEIWIGSEFEEDLGRGGHQLLIWWVE